MNKQLHQAQGRKVLPISEVVEWAFATERVRLDFGDLDGRDRPDASPIWTVVQRVA
jgi:hypothetical protein